MNIRASHHTPRHLHGQAWRRDRDLHVHLASNAGFEGLRAKLEWFELPVARRPGRRSTHRNHRADVRHHRTCITRGGSRRARFISTGATTTNSAKDEYSIERQTENVHQTDARAMSTYYHPTKLRVHSILQMVAVFTPCWVSAKVPVLVISTTIGIRT